MSEGIVKRNANVVLGLCSALCGIAFAGWSHTTLYAHSHWLDFLSIAIYLLTMAVMQISSAFHNMGVLLKMPLAFLLQTCMQVSSREKRQKPMTFEIASNWHGTSAVLQLLALTGFVSSCYGFDHVHGRLTSGLVIGLTVSAAILYSLRNDYEYERKQTRVRVAESDRKLEKSGNVIVQPGNENPQDPALLPPDTAVSVSDTETAPNPELLRF
tara:strand:+ start:1779 stop:2417 length:639 start_codon:yes stop_codon:yes gene_type:complete